MQGRPKPPVRRSLISLHDLAKKAVAVASGCDLSAIEAEHTNSRAIDDQLAVRRKRYGDRAEAGASGTNLPSATDGERNGYHWHDCFRGQNRRTYKSGQRWHILRRCKPRKVRRYRASVDARTVRHGGQSA